MCPRAARPASITSAARAVITSVGREDQGRVEVALDGAVADQRDRVGERGAPVDADDVGTGLAHQPEQVRRTDPEVDPRHAEPAGPLEDPRRVRLHVLAVVDGRERAGPGVEQLDR